MCEWLSYGQWCDVKLLCGGGAFSAHRAVLASVSTFLRRILLSCPIDETPTFIILPDFDLDAMASVLYYIYNGEVIVKKQKLEMFLDIIKTMQIFVDNQYLPQSTESDYIYSDLVCQNETDRLYKLNIFTLGVTDSRDQRYINLKKGIENQHFKSQYSESNFNCTDKLIRSQNSSEECSPPLGNLKSSCGDRQRNSFLRDLFIETYPRNGNVNGLTSSVLAISNECYRAPASVLLTNANGKHLNDTLLEPYKKTSEHISNSSSVFHISKQQRCTPGEQDYGETSNRFYDSFANVCSLRKINNKFVFDSETKNYRTNDWINHVTIPDNRIFQIGVQDQILSGLYVPSVDYSVPPLMFDSVKSIRNQTSTSSSILSGNRNKDRLEKMDTISIPKVTILNHVLDSPWSPRIPINYKPFRRKVEDSLQSLTNQKRMENIVYNDSNNNVKRSPASLNIAHKGDITFTEEEKTIAPAVIPANGIDDFKCTICNQVFASSELLSVHMRRHSTNARYTCSECSKTFSQLRNFKYHMSIHRGTREFAATCTVCGKYFNDRGYLSSHMKIHRNRKEYKCTLCPKSFNQRVAYNMHVRIHTGVKPHVCEQCGKAFSRKMLLKQHQRTHSGERPYACPHCNKRFADRSNMTLHLRLHTGIKPFSCTLCSKSFTKKHHLKSHLNFHTGSKPYSCPRCKLAFTQSSNMRTHLKKCRAPEPSQGTENT